MERPPPVSIIDILRNTLHRLEQSEDFRQEDPAVIELKRHIIQSIAEFEIMRTPQEDSEPANTAERPLRSRYSLG